MGVSISFVTKYWFVSVFDQSFSLFFWKMTLFSRIYTDTPYDVVTSLTSITSVLFFLGMLWCITTLPLTFLGSYVSHFSQVGIFFHSSSFLSLSYSTSFLFFFLSLLNFLVAPTLQNVLFLGEKCLGIYHGK